ncbi:MAG TPA: aminotransferase class III-fold pyridoxal phosphate-dependent enzyme [Gammaproteobacteria bacterium]|nr:aminotransferase class III-fold pyridoxal phosphate-dependent enzyme [Xanthomonadales bacterium]HPI94804.1 aminotransferase class III-fold pyridoxal phosphate-dependent enzyme [Gammaproteobacteria bacterium]
MTALEKLHIMRKTKGDVLTHGLSDEVISDFLKSDENLEKAINSAFKCFEQIQKEFAELIDMGEREQMRHVQSDFVNFYSEDAVNPYVSVAAKGPWLITLKGAVLHDNGGYGMLGAGHAPDFVLETMSRPHVMANIMTPSIPQMRLTRALKKEVGHTQGQCPFEKFVCMNSGSEAVTVAARISDINAKKVTEAGGRHAGKKIKIMSLKGAFHGRTDRPAQYSDSSLPGYKKYLASFAERDNLITIPINDVDALKKAFDKAEKENVFVESLFMEPVMGEGNPGMSITREFYETARQLTKDNGTLLLVDSIQAGLRAHGCLSIVDYAGFEGIDPPDMETYSKALNAGHYPMSVLAMTDATSKMYVKGVYGNTMTANPKAMDVAYEVLTRVDSNLRKNIVERGKEFVQKLKGLQQKLNGKVTNVQGTGLLFSCELAPEYKAYGIDSIEEYMRFRGIGVIHGGANSLRFTPHFAITSKEVDLIIDAVEYAILNGPKANALDKAS